MDKIVNIITKTTFGIGAVCLIITVIDEYRKRDQDTPSETM
jgi:hypothetical protein